MVAVALDGDAGGVQNSLMRGADINEVGRDGVTPLMHCLNVESKIGFTTLLNAGADPNCRSPNSFTILGHAARLKDPFWVNELLQHRADPNIPNTTAKRPGWTGRTPLFCAIEEGNREVVKCLLGAGANPNHRDKGRETPLYHAVVFGRFELLLIMLQNGGDGD